MTLSCLLYKTTSLSSPHSPLTVTIPSGRRRPSSLSLSSLSPTSPNSPWSPIGFNIDQLLGDLQITANDIIAPPFSPLRTMLESFHDLPTSEFICLKLPMQLFSFSNAQEGIRYSDIKVNRAKKSELPLNPNTIIIPLIIPYFVCEAPLPAQFEGFHHDIFTHGTVVVMLSALKEQVSTFGHLHEKQKADPYWPELNQTLIFGALSVTTTEETPLEFYTARTLSYTHLDTGQTKTIRHFQYHGWADHHTPNLDQFFTFRSDVHAAQPLSTNWKSDTTDNPIIIHCSAGVGRTGTYIAIDYLLKTRNQTPLLDAHLINVAVYLRQFRSHMIQTSQQAQFVLDAVRHA